MDKSLIELFDRHCKNTDCPFLTLRGTQFVYRLKGSRVGAWMDNRKDGVPRPSFEHVLDNIPEETQVSLLFHLDYFAGRGNA